MFKKYTPVLFRKKAKLTGWQLTVLLCEGTERRLQWVFCDMLTNRREMRRGRVKC